MLYHISIKVLLDFIPSAFGAESRLFRRYSWPLEQPFNEKQMFDIMQPITRNILLCTVKFGKEKEKLCAEKRSFFIFFSQIQELTLKLSLPMNMMVIQLKYVEA
jgi:hypothetical protein